MKKRILIFSALLLLFLSVCCLSSCDESTSSELISFKVNYPDKKHMDSYKNSMDSHIERFGDYFIYKSSVGDSLWMEGSLDSITTKGFLAEALPDEAIPNGYYLAGYCANAYCPEYYVSDDLRRVLLFDENMEPAVADAFLAVKEDEYNIRSDHTGTYEHDWIDLYPVFKPLTYTFVYDADIGYFENGEHIYSCNVLYHDKIPEIPAPTVYGYTFDGWYNTEGERLSNGTKLIHGYFIYGYDLSDEMVELKAHYIPNEYTVTIDLGLPDVEKIVYTLRYGDELPDLSVYYTDLGTRETIGWSLLKNSVDPVPGSVNGNMTIYPVWRDYKNVEFSFIDGTVETVKLVRDDDGKVEFPQHDLPGYKFLSWLDNEGNTLLGAAFDDLQNTYQGNWQEIDYRVSFICADGVTPSDLSHTYGNITQLPLLEKEGYSFLGWYRDDPESCVFFLPADLWEDVTLTARFAPRVFSVNLIAEGVTLIERFATMTYGENYTITPPPAREGYRFLGWFDAPSGGNQMTDAEGNSLDRWTSLDEGKTFYAVWKAV